MRQRKEIYLVGIIALVLIVGAIWAYRTPRAPEGNPHVFFHADGSPASEEELAWVAGVSDAMSRGSGAPQISGRIEEMVWSYLPTRPPGDNTYTVLRTDGTVVPEEELAWVTKVADTLAREADDPRLQEKIEEDGVYGAFFSFRFPGAMFNEFYSIDAGSPELFVVRTNEAIYYLDRDATLHLEFSDNDVVLAFPFHEGLGVLGVISPDSKPMINGPDSDSIVAGMDPDSISANLEFYYIDREGNIAIPGPFKNALPFRNGIATVSVITATGEKKYGTINKDGTWQIEPKFDILFEFVDGLAAAQMDNPDHTARTAGFVDQTSEFVVTLDNVERMKSSHHDGLALVWRTEAPKQTYVDREGNTVLTPDYDWTTPFHDGMAAVRNGKAWGFIDTTGTEIVPPEFYFPTAFESGIAACSWFSIKPVERQLNEEVDLQSVSAGHKGSLSELFE